MPKRDHTWRNFYRAAMLEADPAPLNARIGKAQGLSNATAGTRRRS